MRVPVFAIEEISSVIEQILLGVARQEETVPWSVRLGCEFVPIAWASMRIN